MALFVFFLILFAAFAWFISWGMVAILFYPKKSIHFIGIHWQAPILNYFNKIDWGTILPKEQLPHQLEQLMPVIEEKLDHFFRNRLAEKLPMISMFIGDKTIQQLKEVFLEELRTMFPELIHSFGSNIQKEWMKNLDQVYMSFLQEKLLEAMAPLRIIAVLMGLLWGAISYGIYCIF